MKYLICCLLTILCIGCKNGEVASGEITNSFLQKTQKSDQSMSRCLGLGNCNQSDSVEIRIWIHSNLRIMQTAFCIKKVNGQWILMRYISTFKTIKNNEDESFVNSDVCPVYMLESCKIDNCGKPKCGWQAFIKRLKIDSLLQITNQADLSTFKRKYRKCDVDDGVSYGIELITKSKYKYVLYHCPKFYAKCLNCKSSEFISNFIDCIYNEFDKVKEIQFIDKKNVDTLDYRC